MLNQLPASLVNLTNLTQTKTMLNNTIATLTTTLFAFLLQVLDKTAAFVRSSATKAREFNALALLLNSFDRTAAFVRSGKVQRFVKRTLLFVIDLIEITFWLTKLAIWLAAGLIVIARNKLNGTVVANAVPVTPITQAVLDETFVTLTTPMPVKFDHVAPATVKPVVVSVIKKQA